LNEQDKEKLLAAIDMIRRTGAQQVQVRYSDDEEPIVWFVVAGYDFGIFEVDASANPVRAALRLCERLVDGSQCTHCGRPAGFEPDSIKTMPLNTAFCWYQYDPENKIFRRGCE
jgi:hypothetical protein